MKIFGFEIMPAKAIEIMSQELGELKAQFDAVQKGGFSSLWEMAREFELFGAKVSKPYSQVPSVYKAIKAIADNAPQAEIGFFAWADNEEVWPEDLVRLFKNPNKKQSEQDFVQELVGYYSLNGEVMIRQYRSIGQAAGSTAPGTYRLPAELRALDPKLMHEVLGSDEEGHEAIMSWRYDGKEVIPVDEIIHIKDFNPDNKHRGLSPTIPLADIIDTDYESSKYNKAFFKNGAILGLILSTDKSLSPEQREQLKAWIDKNHKGATKSHKTAVFENGVKPSTVGSTHKDMDFIEQGKRNEEQTIGTFRAPKALFNITEDLNYATFVGQMKIFALYTLAPIFRKIAGGLNRGVVFPYDPKIELRFKIENMPAFQEDYKEKVTTAQALVQIGATFNDVNEKLNLGFDPYPWGDKWWIPYTQGPAGEYEGLGPEFPIDDTPGEDDPEEDDNAKAIKIRKLKYLQIWKSFLRLQVPLENKMADKIKKYFYQQRIRALKSLDEHKTSIHLHLEKENEDLKAAVTPVLKAAVDAGAEHARNLAAAQKGIADDRLQQILDAYLQVCADKITRINNTIQNKIKESLEKGIAEGLTINELAESVKSIYSMAGNRAKSIARTETTGAVNGGSDLYYKENNIEREWITAGDEAVRETHRNINGEIRRPGQAFSNGLMYPGDQSGEAGDIINCRCTIGPVIR
jgi:HK97 family phage portal protein